MPLSSDTSITNPTGPAFHVQDFQSGSVVNYTGSIDPTNRSDVIDIDTTAAGSVIDFNMTGANFISGLTF